MDRDRTESFLPQAQAEGPPAVKSPAGAHPPLPSQIGRYRIERLLGRGGYGLVYLAHDETLARHVAIKTPHAEHITRPADAEAYLAEARTVAGLDHPHIVPVYDVGAATGFPCFIVSKFIDGLDLTARMQHSPISCDKAAELVATIADALHYAHKHGLVHRDIKPGNILLDRAGQPYLVDFGLALREQDATDKHAYAGTPQYMSPEQARGEGHRVDGRSDIFSLGVVLYQLLLGRRPFRGGSTAELLEQIATHDPKPPRQINDQIPKELERICLKALCKRATDRYTTALDLADDLRAALAAMTGAEQRVAGVEQREPPAVAAHHASPRSATASRLTAESTVDQPPSGPSHTPANGSTPGSHPLRIVPKGLRSFDEHDADFFLELLPGPRDRDGLPDSLRFWKTRIEQTDADNTFAVGLIYGPSGCGKSSLVKAGLLPRLASNIIPIYLEATPDDTETRLLSSLQKRLAQLSPHSSFSLYSSSLPSALAALRRGHVLPPGHKVLIILDQFEQWLHAKKDQEHSELVQALRQCDGAHLQCIVMVRDDFWLAVSRFMRELEVRLVEGHNTALADLFDLDHARKVLAAFGRAFGRLPENSAETSKEQKNFLHQAVAGLSEEGKVISVRLSLLAEMMKGKPWTAASLAAVGGARGVGASFLEETFSAKTASPDHRYHQQAARATLKALLPDSGTNIKGHLRSRDELLRASGYSNRPRDFADLLQILDGELRLITPSDADGLEDARADSPMASSLQSPAFALTHDYLVPSLRDWLTRKQRETRRGRAELRLADRAAAYNARPESRFLPSWWEWPNILLFTRRKNWTQPERCVMRAAGRHFRLRFAGLAAVLLFAVIFSVDLWLRVEQRRAISLADGVFTASADGVPYVMESLRPVGHLAINYLRARLNDPEADATQRLHAAYALADLGAAPEQFLLDSIATAPDVECRNLVASLQGIKESALPRIALRVAATGDAFSFTFPIQLSALPKVRYAIVALQLGDPQPAQDCLALRPDPIDRTTFIHSFANWHGDLSVVANLLASAPHPQPLSRGVPGRGESDSRGTREQSGADAQEQPGAAAGAGSSSATGRGAASTIPPRSGTPGRGAGGEGSGGNDEVTASFRSGLCAALGLIPPDRIATSEREVATRVLLDLYATAPEGGTHSAAGWALRQWNQPLPEIAASQQPAEGRQWHVNGQGIKMIQIPAGRFTIQAEKQGDDNTYTEVPVEVRLPRPFCLSDREVTVGQYLPFLDDAEYKDTEKPMLTKDERRLISPESPEQPVAYVNWFDAVLYCNWLSAKEGIEPAYERTGEKWKWKDSNDKDQEADTWRCDFTVNGYRLPTEAEWEYACRAVTASAFSFGDDEDILTQYCWILNNSKSRAWPGAIKLPSAWGLFDMHGNLWEWCYDSNGSYPTPEGGFIENPIGPETPVNSERHGRVVRGGALSYDASYARSAYRFGFNPVARDIAIGFRPARTYP